MILSNEHIKEVVTNFFKDKPVNKVWLFGSYARGEATDESDIDVMVDIDKSILIGLQFFGWYSDLEEKFHKKVDLVKVGGIKQRILPYVERDLKLIYEK